VLENAADPDILRQSLQAHRDHLLAAAAEGAHPDLGKLTSLDVRLDALIDRWDGLDAVDQRDLTRVVHYVVRVPDDVNDVEDRLGLDDDEERLEQQLADLHERTRD
jgi:hypothetical protein